MEMISPALLQAMHDVGGWIFATAAIAAGAFWVVRWLMQQNEKLTLALTQTTGALDKLTSAVESLTNEVRAGRRR